jgi:6-phosphogluconolactonase
VPGDPVLDVGDADVALAGPYQGRRRMTLTYPTIGRAGSIVWMITGADMALMPPRLMAGDSSIPGGRVPRDKAIMIADRAAAAGLLPSSAD